MAQDEVGLEIGTSQIQVPMSDAELEEKFMTLSVPVVGESNAGRIADLVGRIHACGDVAELMRLTKKRPSRNGASKR